MKACGVNRAMHPTDELIAIAQSLSPHWIRSLVSKRVRSRGLALAWVGASSLGMCVGSLGPPQIQFWGVFQSGCGLQPAKSVLATTETVSVKIVLHIKCGPSPVNPP